MGIKLAPDNFECQGESMKYSANDRIEELYKDCDGWWAVLRFPWAVDDCAGCREDTKRKLLYRIKTEAVKNPKAHE